MKVNIDIRSALIGACAAVLVLLSVGAVARHRSTRPVDRFQLFANDTYVFKIDTTTGQVWSTRASSLSSSFRVPQTIE